MKRIPLTLLLGAAAMMPVNAGYPYIVITHTDGTDTVLKSEGLSLEFSGGRLTASHAEGSCTFEFANLESMEFSTENSGVNAQVSAEVEEVEVYTTDGVFTGRYNTLDEAVEKLDAGKVYVIGSKNGTTKKAIKR